MWNRDYSLVNGLLSVNTLDGRIKVPFRKEGMERFFDGSRKFGTAKLIMKKGKYYLHIPMTKEVEAVNTSHIEHIVGIDLGINFLAATYDTAGKTCFYKGREVKQKRARYKAIRRSLQQQGTASARRRLLKIGSRENRWMTDVNHRISKALVDSVKEGTLFVLEDLGGIRTSTERVRRKHRYETVSWAFAQLGNMIEYKAAMAGHRVIRTDPKHTSQRCPHCAYTKKENRNKKIHLFCCKKCGYRSNDDRIGAMNLHHKGNEYLKEVT